MVLIFPLFYRLLSPGIHTIQDSMQYFRVYEMDKCFSDGQFPCRWVPDLGYGFGYPLFLYYSPAPYYIGVFIHSLGFQYIDTIKVLFILGFIVSALAMYELCRHLFKNELAAVTAAVLYSYAPVRAVQVYVRGSMGEFLSFVFFPWLFLFSYKIIKDHDKRSIIWLGLSTAGLLLTHNLMSLAFFPILGLWSLFWMYETRNIEVIKKLLVGIFIGIGLSAFFVIPLVFERQFVHLETLVGGYFDYRQHFVDLFQLFISNHWGYGSSQLGPGDDLSLSVGQIHWFLWVVAFILAFINRKKRKQISLMIFVLSVVELVSLFLMHEKSSFIWKLVPGMSIFQFPWRFLVTSNFLLSFLAVSGITLMGKKTQIVVFIITLVGLYVLHGSFFRPQKWMTITDNDLLHGEDFIKQQTSSIFDYLPMSAVLPPNYPAKKSPEITSGKAFIVSYLKGSDWQSGKINVISSSVNVRLPIFDFPGMTVVVDGKDISHNHIDCSGQDYCFGQISFKIPQGEHSFSVRLEKTWPRRWGDMISLITLVGLGLVVIKSKIAYET